MAQEAGAILDALPEPMAVVTADGTIVWANTAMRALAGAGRDGLAGRPLADCLGAPAHRCLAILAESCRTTAPLPFSLTLAATGEPVQCRVQAALLARGPDRSTTTVWVRLVQDTEASKNFRRLTQRIADLNREVLARQSAEQALRESEARLAGIISSAMDAIITIDARHRIMDFNGAAERMFRCEAASAVGRSIDGFIPARYRAGHAAHIEAFGRTQVTKRQMGALGTIYGRRADGEEFPIEASISQLETHAGKFYTVILRDITERTRAEEALTSVNAALTARTAALAEANQELESFSYSVSHDLRAPLRTIDAFGRILQEEHGAHLNAEGLRCLAIVRRAAAQAGELIDDLLALSRLGRQSMQIRPVDMAALAREAVEDLRALHEGRTVEVLLTDLPPCRGDRRLLKLLWTNLLSNASKYTTYRPVARIEIGWLPDGAGAETVTYYVKDNGVGFDMRYAHKLFGVFQRLHRKEEFEGTGVGLAIVQRIVHRHGGRVWAEGKPDAGATFYASLPKAG